MADRESSTPEEDTKQGRSFRDVRSYVPQDILDVSFPVAVRGYDRHAVEDYVKRVNRVIAELKVSASPPAAVRHALDQAEEKVEALLHAAREAAEEITASARQEADENTARAKAEAAELMVNTSARADRMKAEADELRATARAEAEATVSRAKSDANDIVSEATTEAQETRARAQNEADERRRQLEEELAALQEQAEMRLHEIERDTGDIWDRRNRLVDDIRATANALVELADGAAARVSPDDAAEPTEIPSRSGERPTQVLPRSELAEGEREIRDEAMETTPSGAATTESAERSTERES